MEGGLVLQISSKIRVERLVWVDFLFQGVTDDGYSYTKSVHFFCAVTGIQNTLVVWRPKGRTVCHRKACRIGDEKFKADFATGSETSFLTSLELA